MSTAIGPFTPAHANVVCLPYFISYWLVGSPWMMKVIRVTTEEMRVMVCGKELSFGKKEFALISGLSFMKSNHNFSRPSTKPRLKMKHFPDEGKPVTGKHLKILLFGKKEKDEKKIEEIWQKGGGKKSREIVVTICCPRVCLGKGNDKVVECDHWYLVDNLVDFNSYPWAEIAFNITLVKSNAALAYQIKHEKPVGSEVTYKCQGMAHVLVVWGLEVLPKLRSRFGSKTIFANWRPHMHSVTCDSVITHESLLKVLEESKGEVCDDIMWHKEDAKRLRSKDMDDEKDEEDLLGNVNMVEEEDLFEKDDEEARVAHPSSQPDVLCSRTSTSVIASFESFVIGEMEVFKSAVKGRLEELSVRDKIGGSQTYIALSKKKTVRHNEEGDFDGAAMQKPDVTPGNGSNSIELNPPYPYNPPNKEVDVSRPVAENICNSSTGKKESVEKIKPPDWPVAPIIVLSDDVTKGRGRARRKINPAYPLLSPYTPTGLVAKKNPKKVSTTNEPVIMNYFEEDILDQRITKQDIDDVNKFINLGIKEHGDNYDGDGTSLLSCSEYKLLLCSTGCALVLLHKSYPSNKSTSTGHTLKLTYRLGLAGRRGLPPSEHLPSWDKVDVVYGVVCIEKVHWTIIIYDSLRPNRNNRSSKIHTEVGQIRDYLEKAYNRGTWCCRYDLKTPKQNDSSSCGVFSFKFIEHMVRKIPVCQVQPDFATRYRCELAVQLFKKQFIEVNGTSGE
ncbi:hypothetical protein MKW92_029151 [Papaver armeniacum]|nr:hypothetical protein MKW92_029151 [Papaver armeniacum]